MGWTSSSLAAAIAFAAFLAPAGPALACSCLGPKDAAQQIGSADVVFFGRSRGTQQRGTAADSALTMFAVSRTLKGPHATVRGVEHHLTGSICGVQFKPGAEYLILASSNAGRLSTNACHTPRFPVADYERAAKAPLR